MDGSFLLTNQPDHGPMAVKNQNELVVGQAYYQVVPNSKMKVWFIGLKLINGNWAASYLTFGHEGLVKYRSYFTDIGIVPYKGEHGDMWNPTNHWQKIEEPPIPTYLFEQRVSQAKDLG